MLIEEIFGTEIPTHDAEGFGSSSELSIGSNCIFQIDDQTGKLWLIWGNWQKSTTIPP